MFSVLLWLLGEPRILSFPRSIFPGTKLNGLSPSARLKEVPGKGRRAAPWRKADLGSAGQGQRESEVERMKELEQPSGRKRRGFAGDHVLRRGSVSAAAKCPPPRRSRPLGGPAAGPMGVARVGRGLRTGAAPARPFRRLRRRACSSAEGRACALSAFLPTSGCRLHWFCSPVPGVIVNPLHGEFPWESTGAQASGSEAGARPEPGRRDGLRAADGVGHVDE